MKYAWVSSRRSAGIFGLQGMLLDTEEASKLCIAPNWLPVSSAFYSAAAKTSIMASQLKSFRLWNKSCTSPQTFLQPFNPCGSEGWFSSDADPTPPTVLTGRCIPVTSWWMEPSRKVNIRRSCCRFPLWRGKPTLSRRTKPAFKDEKRNQHLEYSVSCSFSQRGVWQQEKKKQHYCNVEQFIMWPLPWIKR